MQHWSITREADGLATLTFDRADAGTNTLSAAALAALNEALDILDREPPKGLVVRSGKANGFIAGADVDEFGAISSEEGALALVKRGWDTFERLANVRYPTLALIRGFCLGGGLELALACRYRVAVDEPATRLGLPEVMLGIVPGWGGIKRLPRLIGGPAALDLLLTGKSVDARKAKALGLVDESVPARIMEHTVRGVLRALPPPRALKLPLSLTLNPIARRAIAAQAAKQVAKRARREHYPAPYAILELFAKYDGNALAVPPPSPASVASLIRTPTAENLIRVFRLQERLKGFGKEGGATAAHVHVVGAGTMGGDIAAWCALRGLTVTLQDQNAERLGPAMQRAGKLFSQRLKDPRRRRDAFDRLIPDVAGDGVARADVIIEAIFENVEAKRALFAAVESKAKPTALLATNTSSIPLEAHRDRARRPVAAHRAALLQSRGEDDAGRDRRRRGHEPRPGAARRGVRAPDRQAAAAGEERAGVPGQSRARALPDGGDAGGRRGARARDRRRGGARVRHADGPDRARGHRGPRHLRGRRQAARCPRRAAAPPHGTRRRGAPRQEDRPRLLRVAERQGGQAGAGKVPPGLADRLVQPFVAEARAALAEGIVEDADLVDAGAIFGTGYAPFRGGPLHDAGTPAGR